jgi:hypothetical protein
MMTEEQSIQPKSGKQDSGGMGTGTKILIGIIILIIVLLTSAVLLLNVTVVGADSDVTYPFSTMYGVSFPEGQTITVGNMRVLVLSFENELISDIDGSREKLVVGEDRKLSERRAKITAFGIIPIADTNFQITLKYKGERENRAYFDMTLRTSKQVPDFLIKRLLPAEIDARPIQIS